MIPTYHKGQRNYGTGYDMIDLIDSLEAKLAKAVDTMRWYHDQMCEGFCNDLRHESAYTTQMDDRCAGCKARATIAEITGDKQ